MIENNEIILERINQQRSEKGFLTLYEVMGLGNNNIVFDPFSTLISNKAAIGSSNVFYPSVIIEVREGGVVEIGNNNIFHSQTNCLAGPGTLIIGNDNQFGDGGISVKSNGTNTVISIGNMGRYINGVQILGNTVLGDGTQIIGGMITVQDCKLEGGKSFNYEDPDLRGAVLKGYGVARNINLCKGQVLNGLGLFDQKNIQHQSFYHPKK
jgi:hypothetical protein